MEVKKENSTFRISATESSRSTAIAITNNKNEADDVSYCATTSQSNSSLLSTVSNQSEIKNQSNRALDQYESNILEGCPGMISFLQSTYPPSESPSSASSYQTAEIFLPDIEESIYSSLEQLEICCNSTKEGCSSDSTGSFADQSVCTHESIPEEDLVISINRTLDAIEMKSNSKSKCKMEAILTAAPDEFLCNCVSCLDINEDDLQDFLNIAIEGFDSSSDEETVEQILPVASSPIIERRGREMTRFTLKSNLPKQSDVAVKEIEIDVLDRHLVGEFANRSLYTIFEENESEIPTTKKTSENQVFSIYSEPNNGSEECKFLPKQKKRNKRFKALRNFFCACFWFKQDEE